MRGGTRQPWLPTPPQGGGGKGGGKGSGKLQGQQQKPQQQHANSSERRRGRSRSKRRRRSAGRRQEEAAALADDLSERSEARRVAESTVAARDGTTPPGRGMLSVGNVTISWEERRGADGGVYIGTGSS